MRRYPVMANRLIGVCDKDRWSWIATKILPLEPDVRAWLRRQRPVGIEADDLIQEAYTRLASLPSVDHIAHPRPYFFRTIKSLILTDVRHPHRLTIEFIAGLEYLEVSSEERCPERILSGHQQLERLAAAIEHLPAGCREVFRLRKFEHLSQKQLAMRLKISENTVEKQLARALKILRRCGAEFQQTA
jgi:RNA polymerase sigma factor (sigma-70 family)